MDDVLQSSGLPPEAVEVIRRLVSGAGYDLDDEQESILGMNAALATLQVCDAARQRRAPREAQVGRNEPCPCGSGKKHKKCCLGRNSAPPVARGYAPGNPVERPELVPRLYDLTETGEALDRLHELFQRDTSLRRVRFNIQKVLTFLWDTQEDTASSGTATDDPDALATVRERTATRYLREVEGIGALGNVRKALLQAARDSAHSDADVRSLATGLAMMELEPDEDEAADEDTPANPLLVTIFLLTAREALADLAEMADEEDARLQGAPDAPGESSG